MGSRFGAGGPEVLICVVSGIAFRAEDQWGQALIWAVCGNVFLDPTPRSCKKVLFYMILGDGVHPIWTKTVVNRLAMAHQRLILCHEGATPYIDLLEVMFQLFPYIFTQFWPKMLDF